LVDNVVERTRVMPIAVVLSHGIYVPASERSIPAFNKNLVFSHSLCAAPQQQQQLKLRNGT
jgi:hypothetical protein